MNRQLRIFISSLMISASCIVGVPSVARAGDCDIRSESFDASTLTLDPKTYKTDSRSCHLSGGLSVVSLRLFELSHQPYAWVVDQDRVVTGLVKQECLQECVALTDGAFPPSTYETALQLTTAAPQPLQDGGVKHAASSQIQMYVTADLCPSEKPMVREVLDRMVTLAASPSNSLANSLIALIAPQFTQRTLPTVSTVDTTVIPPVAVPVALSVSGVWMLSHSDDIDYLKSQERLGRLQITWVNHTYTHPYDPSLPLEHNFVLKTGVDFTREILENEKLMLKLGMVPSIFVRLPGLISDQVHMNELRGWGLIPLGADAWLAKGQDPKNGSIILIHANGNEPKGIRIFEQLLGEHSWWMKIFKSLPNVLQGGPEGPPKPAID